MKQESISEQNIRPEDMELGGNSVTYLDTRTLTKPVEYWCKSYDIEPTEWGNRVRYLIFDDNAEHFLTSWNFVCKQKFKVPDLIGKKIKLTPVEGKDANGRPKKPILTFEVN